MYYRTIIVIARLVVDTLDVQQTLVYPSQLSQYFGTPNKVEAQSQMVWIVYGPYLYMVFSNSFHDLVYINFYFS